MPSVIPNLSALRTFVEAARAESFTRAARAVHITQGAVSRQMRALELADLHAGGAHAAIRYGLGTWPGTVTRRIFAETLVPVASPAVARGLAGRDFWSLPRLSAGSSALDSAGDIDWRAWSEGAGETVREGVRYRRLRDYQRVIHSARAGQGVAIARTRLF